MSLLVLPPEVTDIVIGHLHNDKASLASCSLVCKALTPTSQSYIFRSIVFCYNPMSSSTSSSKFFELVQAFFHTQDTATKRHEIREFTIVGEGGLGRHGPSVDDDRIIPISLVHSVLQELPNLRVFRLLRFNLPPLSLIPSCERPPRRQLSELDFRSHAVSLSTLSAFLCYFEEVNHLKVSLIGCTDDIGTTASGSVNGDVLPQISRLSISGWKTYRLLRHLLTPNSTLTSLRLNIFDTGPATEDIGAFIRVAGTKLEYLHITLPTLYSDVSLVDRYNVSSCVKLVELSLALVLDLDCLQRPQTTNWDCMISLLSAIPTPLNLRQFTFTLSFVGSVRDQRISSLQVYDWGLMDQALARFRDLERVAFLGAEDGLVGLLGDLRDFITEHLPILSAALGERLVLL
ncbi:unnamed protein product [Somion occarium]